MRCIHQPGIRGIFLLALVLGLVPSLGWAQVLETEPDILAPGESSAQEDADLQEEPAAFGYLVQTGELALALDTAAVFCPDSGSILVDPNHADATLAQLGATDVGDGSWEVPDPDTGEAVTAQVQFASATFDDGSANEDPSALTQSKAALRVVTVSQVVRARWFWPRCWRLRYNHICGVNGTCPWNGLCLSGYYFSQRRKFLRCTRWPGFYCLEFLYPVCTVTKYTCRDCTGPVLFRRPLNRFVCALP